ncbi:DUF1499 domain-containing protein [Psychromonas sp.]|uniref:DUF1499 domain-containing protein n=1 Tax=Psychromonas sp. TaxID=1884585 RepID=UPI003567B2CF
MSLLKNSRLLSSLILLISTLCLGVIVISILGVRGDWFGIRTAFTTIAYAAQAAILILLAAVVIFYLSRGNISSQVKSGLAIILVLIPVIGHYANQPEELPPGAPLNDISTDTVNPPVFNAVIALRPANSNTSEYPGATAAARQKELFPDIAPIESSLSAEQAFKRALDIAEEMNWDIVSQEMSTGIIEAVAATAVFNFKDDIVIRIQATTSGSIVDIRSHSRIGRSDRGKNAERVREFIKNFK